MATRSIKGVLVRNDWQFFESACAICAIQTNLPAGVPGIALVNNSTQGESLDVYRAEINLTQGGTPNWTWAGPTVTFVSVVGPNIEVYAHNLIQKTPVGKGVAFSSSLQGLNGIIHNRNDTVNFDSIELENGGPFITLPAGYAITCVVPNGAGVSITAVFWYQVMTDQIVPAQ